MAVWVEELRVNSFKICLQEAKIFDGPHKNIKIVSKFAFVALFLYTLLINRITFSSQENLGGNENEEYLSLHSCIHVHYNDSTYSRGQPNHCTLKEFSPLLSIFTLLKKLLFYKNIDHFHCQKIV